MTQINEAKEAAYVVLKSGETNVTKEAAYVVITLTQPPNGIGWKGRQQINTM